jgi:DUF4097 and DUF4098 domain-containing protein YvlB
MNKFIKVCLSIVGVLMAFGLVLFVIGAMFGGINQVADITRRGGFNYTFSNGNFHVAAADWNFDDYDYDEYYDDFEEYKEYEFDDLGDVADINEVKIEVGACKLDVLEYDGATYKVEVENVYHLKCFVEEGVLNIGGERDTFPNIGERRVTLYVPKGAKLDNLDISLGAGVGEIEAIEAQEIDIEVGAGELTGVDLTAEESDISVGAGSVSLRGCEFGDVKFEVGVGSASYKGVLTGDAKVDCGMGNVSMKLDGEREDFNYRLECAMGEIDIDGKEYSGLGNSKREDNDAVNTMDLDCSMGHISVKFNEEIVE